MRAGAYITKRITAMFAKTVPLYPHNSLRDAKMSDSLSCNMIAAD